ncbi:HNH endonuclease [Pseudochrobactrum asaccharolyticum]|uniref:5-methylcytosine-specific restriction protein A n=1 Tax=Pseudochrobactrum asaccharolyticum TaxID=354351 RepID=A0A366DLW7_9HYPH|nr:HNH endonuclease [Pseudochrobactrum asaccharolyticum]RBO91051.1 5-methylcytosine-specific restriction protein A [Pseudochrobactrum asaccharolyticum]
MSWNYERGRIYNRRTDIHGRYQGQQQGGIITPAKHALVIIITGEAGEEHGYADRWRTDGVFEYFGEGQIGNMQMHKGNAAIANHSSNGKSLLLFAKTKQGLRFEDEFICEAHHTEKAPDREGTLRDAIVFELRPMSNVLETVELQELQTLNIEELRKKAFASASMAPSKSSTTTTVYERSRHVRDYVVARSNGNCEGCGLPAPFKRPNGIPYLEPHHIRRLTDGGPDNPKYVIALCPNCHRRVHSGADGITYNDRLAVKMKAIEVAKS